MKRIVSLLLIAAFIVSSVMTPGALALSTDCLAPASTVADPDGQARMTKEVEPGAIGNGPALVRLLQGPNRFPPKADLMAHERENIHAKIREAISIATDRLLAKKNDIPGYADRVDATLANLITLDQRLSDRLYLMDGTVDGPENYLIGFNYNDDEYAFTGIDADLAMRLSPLRLAQYIFHECVPEHMTVDGSLPGGVDRRDHQAVYTQMQTVVFGPEEVAGLKKDLRGYINERTGVTSPMSMERVDTSSRSLAAIPQRLGQVTAIVQKEGYGVTPDDQRALLKILGKYDVSPGVLSAMVVDVKDSRGSMALVSNALSLARRDKTPAPVARTWLAIVLASQEEGHRHLLDSIRRWSLQLAKMTYPNRKWTELGQQEQGRLSDAANALIKSWEAVGTDEISLLDVMRLYVARDETFSSASGPEFEYFVGLLAAILDCPLNDFEIHKRANPFVARLRHIVDLVKKGHEVDVDMIKKEFGEEGGGYRSNIDIEGLADAAQEEEGALLLSGRGMSDAQHRLVNAAIGTCFTAPAPGAAGVTPQLIADSDLAAFDPKGILKASGIKVYIIDGLNEKIKEIARQKSVSFDDEVIIHPGTFQGKERHLFIDSKYMPKLISLSERSRTAIVEHENCHVMNRTMSEKEVAGRYPIVKALSELRFGNRYELLIPEAARGLTAGMEPRGLAIVAGALESGLCTVPVLARMAEMATEITYVERPVERALVLAEQFKVRPLVAMGAIDIANACERAQPGYPKLILKWEQFLTSELYGKDALFGELEPYDQQDISAYVAHAAIAFNNELDTPPDIPGEIPSDESKIGVKDLLRLFVAIIQKSDPGAAIETFDAIVELVRDTRLTKLEEHLRLQGRLVNVMVARIDDIIDFIETTKIVDVDRLETLLTKGKKAAYAEFFNPLGGNAILVSGKGLDDAGHRLVNKAIASYFAVPGQEPKPLDAGALKSIDPAGILGKDKIKVYALAGLNEKIRKLVYSLGGGG